MSASENVREQLSRTHPEYRRLLEEHQVREERLEELQLKRWLSSDEEQEQKRLKIEKLRLKDKMEELLRLHAS